MAIGTPWVGAAVLGSVSGSNVLTATVNVSGATDGEVAWIIGAFSNAQPADITPPAGWTSFSQMTEGAAASTSTRAVAFWKVKQASDTTVTITDATNWTNSCRVQFQPISWPGVDTATPAESAAWATRTTLGTTYPTGSGTPTLGDRWAVGVFLTRGTTANTAWTSDAALTSRATPGTTGTPFFSLLVADSAAAVTQAAHTYTATGQSASHGIGGVFYLVPAASATPSGSAALSGSGTLALTGAPATPGTVALSGSGSLSTAGQPALPGSLPLSGGGTLTPAGAPRVAGSVALAGAGTLTGSAPAGNSGTAALAGSGTLALTGQPTIPGQLGLVGTGALGLQGAPGMKDNLPLTGSGQFAAMSLASARDLTLAASVEPDRWASSLEPDRWTAEVESDRWTSSLEPDRWTAELEPNRWEGAVPWPEL